MVSFDFNILLLSLAISLKMKTAIKSLFNTQKKT